MPPKVTRSGNSTMLPLPTDLARAVHAELGDKYPVELLGDDLLYHRSSEQVTIAGSVSCRTAVRCA
jgi:antitoxin component of MazEF toxin-antitoxin module